MVKARYEHCIIYRIRSCVEERLDLPPFKGHHETAAAFWERVEKAGLLVKALALYDRIAADIQGWKHLPRETKEQFARRIEREGRSAEVERARQKLLASGLSQRETQEKLVETFQPLDGKETRAWETPDPWLAGRLFHRKADHLRVLELTIEEDDPDPAVVDASERLEWAEHRLKERQALAEARRRARRLKQDSPEGAQPQLA